MDVSRQKREVDDNYDVFVRELAVHLPAHRDEYALMRHGKIIGFYKTPGDANRAGVEHFADDIYSIQEVTDEPLDLGFWTHLARH